MAGRSPRDGKLVTPQPSYGLYLQARPVHLPWERARRCAADEAVASTRANYQRWAVETPWQKRVRKFPVS